MSAWFQTPLVNAPTIARISNSLIEALNENVYLPKFVIMIIDKDIVQSQNNKSYGARDDIDATICRQVQSKLNTTRKSSCVNARGIPPAAYQVLHLLPYRGGNYPGCGVPTLAWGVSHLWSGGTPHLDLVGVPPPPRCGQTDTCENSSFPHHSDAGGKN